MYSIISDSLLLAVESKSGHAPNITILMLPNLHQLTSQNIQAGTSSHLVRSLLLGLFYFVKYYFV